MVLVGTSIILASLSICAFHWRSTIWRSWIRRLPFVKDEAPPHSNHAPQKSEEKSQKRNNGFSNVSADVVDAPTSNDTASNTSAVARHFVPSVVPPSDSPTTTKAISENSIAPRIAKETTACESSGLSSSMKPSPGSRLSPTALMPPPPRPSKPAQRTRLTPSKNDLQSPSVKQTPNSLRPPTLGPSPNRTASLAPNPRSALTPLPTTSTLPAASRPRMKVILSPGHSPLDWAHLTSKSPSHVLSGVPALQRVTPTQLKTMNGRKGRPAWSSYKGRVYNIGPYLPFHPGGEGELMRGAGKEAGKLFEEVHPWVNWEGMMGSCVVGIMVGETETASNDDMEDMD